MDRYYILVNIECVAIFSESWAVAGKNYEGFEGFKVVVIAEQVERAVSVDLDDLVFFADVSKCECIACIGIFYFCCSFCIFVLQSS